jgi:DNA-binding transcriptional LysR family regulator
VAKASLNLIFIIYSIINADDPADAPMNLNTIDLNLFVAFDVIYTERNLTRASEVLSITQPAVSNTLARLRATFGDRLFVRTGNAMMPTPVAQSLIGPVRQALRQLRASVDQVRKFEPATSEKIFNLSIGDGAATILMPEIVTALRKEAPQVKVHCSQVDRREIASELASGDLDFALDIPETEKPDLNGVEILQDRYVCVLRQGHPFAKRPLTVADYLKLEHVMVSSRRRGRNLVDIALARLGSQANTALRVMHFQSALHVVMGSDMAVTAPLSLAARYEVVRKELPFEVPTLRTMLYWHRNADHDPANIWMRHQIIDASRRLAPNSPAKGEQRRVKVRSAETALAEGDAK